MKKILMNAGFGAAILLSALAIPSYADTTLQFASLGTSCTASSGACGTATDNGSGSITGFSILDFTTLTVKESGTSVETWNLSGVTFTDSGSSYALSFTATCASGLCGSKSFSGSNLIQFTTAAAPTYSGSLAYSIAIGTPTTLTETATFLNDLSLSTPSGTLTGSGSAASTGTGTSLNLTNSNALSIESAGQIMYAPEPVSYLLFGTGLLAIGIITRRKNLKVAEQKA